MVKGANQNNHYANALIGALEEVDSDLFNAALKKRLERSKELTEAYRRTTRASHARFAEPVTK